jgi:hypothetical protein
MDHRIAYRIDLYGGGRQDRTADLRVMNPTEATDSKQDKQLSSAESGNSQQGTHLRATVSRSLSEIDFLPFIINNLRNLRISVCYWF